MRRTPVRELLDTDSGTPAEIGASLADLGRINRWFGGISTSHRLIATVAKRLGSKFFTVLEVAAGSGDLPTILEQRLQAESIALDITLLDRAPSHLANGIGSRPRIAGDALHLPFQDGTFDLVSSSLFAHHLSPNEVLAFVNESLRVCRTAVIINDLIRHPIHLGLVYAGMPLYRSRITRHDAVASVRQAYTLREMRGMLAQTADAQVDITTHYLFRMGVIAWKHTPKAVHA
jgi:ubiquinone/menaquinone biosynthesis C-methylase UbiE